jgi:hypothetical protein
MNVRAVVLVALFALMTCAMFAQSTPGSIPQVATGTWASTGQMSQARTGAAAAVMYDGSVLVVGGTDAAGNVLATAERYEADGTFHTVSPMQVARTGHTATWVFDGYVLVAGGTTSGGGVVNSAELYDPLNDQWTMLPGMVDARTGHTATVLPNGGDVLLAGGRNSSGTLADLEIFSLSTGTFSSAGAMSSPRVGHAAAALVDGRIFIVGGTDANGATLASTEIYDPTSGQTTLGPALNTPRTAATATTLLDTTVLIAGGSYPEGAAANGKVAELTTAEIFSPAAQTITALTAQMNYARTGQLAFLLPNNNNVLLDGGTYGGTSLSSAELYTPWTQAFSLTGSMLAARSQDAGGALSPLANGLLLMAGGNDLASAELYGFATVQTNAHDYAPGTPVQVTGSGWVPGETVNLVLHELQFVDATPLLAAVADGSGNIANSAFAPSNLDVGVRFYLTAIGQDSEAQLLFSDATYGPTITNSCSPNGSTSLYVNNPTLCTVTVATHSTCTPVDGTTITWSHTGNGNYSNTTCQLSGLACAVTYTPTGTSTESLTASYPGSTGCNSGTKSVTLTFGATNPVPTTTSLSPSSANVGGASFGLTVNGTNFETGSVVDFAGVARATTYVSTTQVTGTILASDLANAGTVNITVANPTPGGGASNVLTFTINKTTPTTTVTLASGTPTYGNSLTFSAAVAPPGSGAAATGTVSFYDGGTCSTPGATLASAVALSSGSASFSTGTLTGGAHTILACYSGNSNYNTSSGTLPETISKAVSSTTLSLTAGSNPSTYGTSLTFKATVTSTATGTVSFYDGGTCSIPGATLSDNVAISSGSAGFSLSNLSAATHSVLACYSGDGNYLTSTDTASQTVNPVTLTVNGITASGKVYDGGTTATISVAGATLSGVLSGDTNNVTLVTTSAVGEFTSAAVGSGMTVNISGMSLTGSAAGNYVLSSPQATATAAITAKALTITGLSASNKTYDGTTTASLSGTPALAGVVSGDTVTLSGTATAAFSDKNIGAGKTVTVAGLSLSGSSSGNYTLTLPSFTANITAAGLTVNGITANNKVYDATTSATLNTGSAALVGVVSGDTITLSTAGASGTFATKNVGAGVVVQVSGLTISGASSGNYLLTQPATTANITARPLTVTAATNTKQYDSTITAAALPTLTSGNLVNSDSVTWSETYDTSAVGTGKTLTPSGTVSDGNGGNNYSVTFVPNTSGVITSALLTVSGITANNKMYDGTTVAGLNLGSAALVGKITGDAVTLSTTAASGAFAGKNIGAGIVVQVSGLTISGVSAGNYALTQPTTTANITVRAITVTAPANSKQYDGTILASTLPTITSGSLASGDSATWSETYDTKNVGSGKTLTPAGTVSDGNGGANYSVTFTPSVNGVITAVPLTVSGITANNKIYDGGTTATIGTAGATLSGVLSGDASNVTLVTTGAAGLFASPGIGNGKTVNISGMSLTGSAAMNYALPSPQATATANITAVALTITGLSANNKTYDGTTSATFSGTPALVGVIAGDTVTLSGAATGTFADKNVGMAKAVTVSGLSLSGSSSANYTLTLPSLTANISAATLTVSGITVSNKVYDGTTAATLNMGGATLVGVAGGDTITLNTAGASGTFATKNVGAGIVVQVSGLTVSGTGAGNYNLTQPATTANVTARPLTVTAATNTKQYDATTSAAAKPTLTSGNLVNSDTVTWSESYNTDTVGTGKTLTPAGTVSDGNGGNNYNVTFVVDQTGIITAAPLTVSGISANNKTYDGSTVATLNTGSAALVGRLDGDDVTLNTAAAIGAFAGKNVGAGILVQVSGLTTSGSDSSNYTVIQPSTAANITLRAITVTAAANSKQYDGTTLASAVPTITSGSLASGDSVTWSETYDTKNTGAGKTLTPSGAINDGNGGANYSVTATPNFSGIITAAPLTLTGLSANNKVYDQTTAATINVGGASLTGVLTGDTVTLNASGATATFASASVGTGIPVSVSGLSLSGSTAGNYALTQPSGLTANITAANVTASVTAANKAYDRTVAATITACTLSGIVGSDSVSCSAASASFASANVGAGIVVTANGITLSGTAAGNYTLAAGTASTTANISAISVTASVTAASKSYDGTTAATITGCTLSGVLPAEAANVTCAAASASFASANAGTGTVVTASGIALSGTAAGNYTLAAGTANTTANISAISVTASVTAASKTYDATAAATLTSCTLSNVLAADAGNVLCSGSGSFASPAVGAGKVVIASVSLSGTAAGNYALASNSPATTASVIAATVTASVTAANKNYDGTTTATIATCTLAGVLAPDAANVTCAAAAANFASANVGTGITVTATGITLSGTAAGNYLLSSTTANATANIQAALTAPKAIPYMTSIQAGGSTTIYTVGAACPSGSGRVAVDQWGDGCLATEANLGLSVEDAVAAQDGSIYLAARSTTLNSSAFVRKIDPISGVISVFAGGGTGSCANPDMNVNGGGNTRGDGCPATAGVFADIRGLAIDNTYLYISDYSNSKIHRVGLSANPIAGRAYANELELVVGTGTTPWNGDGAQSTVNIKNPGGIAVDAHGNVFWGDGGTSAYAVRMIDYSANPPQIHTVVNYSSGAQPTAACESGSNLTVAVAKNATVNGIYALTFDNNGNLYFGDKNCYSVRKVAANASGIVDGTGTFSTLIGNGASGSSNGTWYNVSATPAYLGAIRSVATAGLNGTTWVSNTSNLYISTTNGIWFYDASTGWVHQIMNGGGGGCVGHMTSPYIGCAAPNATFNGSGSNGGDHMSVDQYGNLYVADYGNGLVTKLGIGTDFVGVAPAVGVSTQSPATHQTLVHGSGTCGVTNLSAVGPFTLGTPSCSTYGTGTDLQTDWVVSVTYAPTAPGPQTGTLAVDSTNIGLDAFGDTPVTVTCSSGSKTYGNADPAVTYTTDQVVPSWTVAPVCAVSAENGAIGSPYAITVSNCATLAASGFGPFTCNAGQLTVNPQTVTATVTAAGKTYDSTTSANVSCTLTGVIGSDNVTCTVGAADFASANIGTGIVVNATGITLGGSAAGNYALTSTSATSAANITAAAVMASVTAANKAYDGTTVATIAGCTLSGVLPADAANVSCAAASASLASSSVGTGVAVTATGITLGGSAAGNYTLTSTSASTTANITAIAVTASVTASNKVYDSTTSATITGCTLSGVLPVDAANVTCSANSASFASATAGTGITVTATGITLGGTAAGNYTLASTSASTTANIATVSVTASVTAANKTYDATTVAALTGCTLSGVLSADTGNVTCGGSGAFAGSAIGTGKVVTASISLSGTAAGNYTLTSSSPATTASIVAATVTANVTADNKIYDGTTSATIGSCTLSGVMAPDAATVACSVGSASFASSNVGAGITVTATGITLTGSAAGNYVLSSTTATTTANIDPAFATPKAIPYMTSIQAGGSTATFTVGGACPTGGRTATDQWGDGCLATESNLGLSVEVAVVGPDGAMYVAARSTTLNSSAFVRRIDPATGVITVFAGGGTGSCTTPDTAINGGGNTRGDGCPATSGVFTDVRGLAIDSNYLYVSDYSNSKIHRVGLSNSALSGRLYAHELELVAGGAATTWNGDGAQAVTDIKNPEGIAVDTHGNVFWGDGGSSAYAVRMIDYSANPPQIHTVVSYSAGSQPTAACETGSNLTVAVAKNATVNGIYGLTFDSGGNLYFGDKNCYSVRKVTPNAAGIVDGTGTFSTLLGTGTSGSSSGTWYNTVSTPAYMGSIRSVATAGMNGTTWVSNTSNLYISTTNGIWFYDASTGWIHQIMNGGGAGCTGHTVSPYIGCPAPTATFNGSGSNGGDHMTVDQYGNLYVADYGNGLVTKLGIGTDFVGVAPAVGVSTQSPATHPTLVHGTGTCGVTSLSAVGPFALGTSSCSTYGAGTDMQTDWVVPITYTPTAPGAQTGTLTAGSTNIGLDAFGDTPVTVTCNSSAKTYGNADPAFGYTANQTVTAWTVAPVCAVGAENGAIGSPYAITVSNCATLAASGFGPFTCNAGQLTVNPQTVTATVTAAGKTYDSTTSANVSCTLTGVIGSDNVTCTVGAANFASANIGTGIVVNATGITLGGSAAGNYALASTSAGSAANIIAAAVTASVTAANKTYDGTTAATITGCTLSGVLPVDQSNLTCTAGGPNNFASATVGSGIAVTANGITLSGTAAGNYTLAAGTASTTANVNAISVTASVTAAGKSYDGTTAATITGCTLSGVLPAEAANVTCAGTGSFADANIGASKTVTATVSLGGSAAGNYALSSNTPTTTATITAITVTASVSAANKTYDGTNLAAITACTLSGVIPGDAGNVTCSPAALTFATANPGTAIPVTATGITLSGSAAGNYLLSSVTATTAANIVPATVTAIVTASNKPYDGTTTATMTGCTLTGVVPVDAGKVVCAGTSATFASPNPGNGITVTVTGISLSGTAAASYALSSTTATTTANILAVNVAPKAIPYITSKQAGGSTTTFTVGGTCPSGRIATDQWGDGCLGSEANLGSSVEDAVTDANGNMYVGARSTLLNGSAFVRKIDAVTGVITVFAGGGTGSTCPTPDAAVNGSGNNKGDGCPPTYGVFSDVRGLAVDATYLYISDYTNSRIHRVGLSNAPLAGRIYAHELELVAGTGSSGWNGDGPQSLASIKNPYGIAVDAHGNVFWGDGGSNSYAVRMVDYSANPPQIRTVVNAAGAPTYGCQSGSNLTVSQAKNAVVDGVNALAFDQSGNLYFVEKKCFSVRKVAPNASGIVDGTGAFSTLLGNGTAGSTNASWYNTLATTPAAFKETVVSVTTAGLNGTTWTSNSNNLYISTYYSVWMYDAVTGWMHEIMDTTGGTLGCTANGTTPFTGCPAPNATFLANTGGGHMSPDLYGNLYVADFGNGQVTKLGVGTDFTGVAPQAAVNPAFPVTQQVLLHGSGTCAGTSLSAASPFSAAVGTCSTNGTGTDQQTDWVVPVTYTPTAGGSQSGTLVAGSVNLPLDGWGYNQVTVTCDNKTKTYGDADPAFTYSTIQTVPAWTVAPVCTVAAEDGVAHSPYAVTVSNCVSLVAPGFDPFVCNAGQLTVTPKTVTPTVTAAAKTYDTTTAATAACSLSGVINGDNVTCSVGAANFVTANTGTGITVNAAGITLSGPAASNYALSSTAASTTANIAAAPVTATVTAADKLYNTTTAAVISGCALSGVLPADAANVTCSATGTFAGASVGVGETVTANVTLGGSAAGNYALTSASATTTASINPAPVTATITAANKPYDGTANAAITVCTLSGVYPAEAANVSCSGTGTFASATAGYSKTVTGTISLSGSAAGNYAPSSTPPTTTANITAMTVTANVTAADKTYDGTNSATITGCTVNGALAADTANLSCSATGTFATPSVGTGRTVTANVSLSGSAAVNYTLLSPSAITYANIEPVFVAAAVTVANKTYDATTAATIPSCTLNNVLPADSANVSCSGIGSFANASVGSGKTVTVNVSLSGSTAGNYVLMSSTLTSTASISAASVTASVTAANKAYDGTIAATINGCTLTNVVPADTANVTCSATGAFADASVGSGKTVTATASLNGMAAGNYALTSVSPTTTANISAVSVTATVTAASKIYDATTTATITGCTLTGILAVDTGNVSCSGAGIFVNASVGSGKTVTANVSLSGPAAGNYTLLSASPNALANITPASLTASVTAANKTYDATTGATITGCTVSGVLAADAATVSCTGTGNFSDPSVGTGKTVSATVSLSGVADGNYTLSSTSATTMANINPVSLTATVTAANKTYDGTNTASITGCTLSTVLATDAANVSCAGTGNFATALVENGKTVTATVSLSGSAASNYALSSNTAVTTANITGSPVTASVTASSKTYDGTTTANITGCTLSGVLAADAANVGCSATGTYVNANVGSGKTITANIVLTGSAAPEYTLSSTTATTTADITTLSLTAGVTAANKAYDATNTANIAGCTLSGVLAADAANVGCTGTGSFSNPIVGNGKTVTATVNLTGSAAPNYALASGSVITTANINPLTVTAIITAANKGYDSTTAAFITNCTVTGVLSADTGNVSCTGTGTFATSSPGTNKVVTATVSLSGSAASNYSLSPNTATTTASINGVSVTATVTAANKSYDGNPLATLTNCILTGVPQADSGNVNCSGTASFANATVGSNKLVTATVSLVGSSAVGYSLTSANPTTTASIFAATVTPTVVATGKQYDGTTNASLTCSLAGVIGGDDATCSATGSFPSVNVGTQTISATIGLSGTTAPNYLLTATAATPSASITPVTPTISMNCPTGVVYDGTAHFCTPSATGLANATINGSYTWSPAATETVPGQYALTATFSSGDTNYSNGAPAIGQLNIAQAVPNVTVSCPTGVTYDGKVHTCSASALTAAGVPVNGSFSWNPAPSETLAGSYPTITATFTSTDPDYGNGNPATTSFVISSAQQTVTLSCPTVIYDGQTHGCTVTPNPAGHCTGLTTSINAGIYTETATCTANDSNYAGGSATSTLTISPAVLTVKAINASRAVAAANPTFTYSITGFVGTDTPQTATTGVPSLTTGANSSTPAGYYAISAAQGTLQAANYTFNLVPGTLTIGDSFALTYTPSPTIIYYGTGLLATQLEATAINPATHSSVAGTYAYTQIENGQNVKVTKGDILPVGSVTVTVTFTPNQLGLYTTTSTQATITVLPYAPVLTWTPKTASLVYGSPLGTSQLNATAKANGQLIPGTTVYQDDDTATTTLSVGYNQLHARTHHITVTFHPTDTTSYVDGITATADIQVTPATLSLTYSPSPASLEYRQALTTTGQLSAVAKDRYENIATGSLSFTENQTARLDGDVLQGGPHLITASFAPALNSEGNYDYLAPTSVSKTIMIEPFSQIVMTYSPIYTPSSPNSMVYGDTMVSGQFLATANTLASDGVTLVPIPDDPGGSYTYTYLASNGYNYHASLGFTPPPGTGTLKVVYTPGNHLNYATGHYATAGLVVARNTPTVNYNPTDDNANIVYGTSLGAPQLNAALSDQSIHGTFMYSIGSSVVTNGTTLRVGQYTIKAVFYPSSTTDYTSAQASTTITVSQFTPTLNVTFHLPANHGTHLSTACPTFSAKDLKGNPVYGTFTFTDNGVPVKYGSYILGAGTHQIALSFQPTDSTDYSTPPSYAVSTFTLQ